MGLRGIARDTVRVMEGTQEPRARAGNFLLGGQVVEGLRDGLSGRIQLELEGESRVDTELFSQRIVRLLSPIPCHGPPLTPTSDGPTPAHCSVHRAWRGDHCR